MLQLSVSVFVRPLPEASAVTVYRDGEMVSDELSPVPVMRSDVVMVICRVRVGGGEVVSVDVTDIVVDPVAEPTV